MNTINQVVARSARRMKAQQKIQNTSVVSGSGALGAGDRGSFSFLPFNSGNPYNFQDYVSRWRQYVQMYETCWEARKIVRIIPEDALRKEWLIEDIPEEMITYVKQRSVTLQFLSIMKRSLILERLLGGCLLFMGIQGTEEDLDKPFHPSSTVRNNLIFCNAIPLSRIARVDWCQDPLSEHYMRPEKYLINGSNIHVSRCLVWDGEPLFDPYDYALTNFRSNLAGFGESKLATVWDDVIKAVGTRQAAYQLIETNNAIIMAVQDLQDLQGTKTGKQALAKLQEIANQISVYRAAMVDGEKVTISQQAASFGSVPELMLMFLQVLSAASDIPATRFIGQAPGGLNATGDSDLENYYNVIDAYQQQRIVPNIRRFYDILLYPKFGGAWDKEREKLSIKFPPLWNQSELEQAQQASAVIDNVLKLVDRGLMGDEKAINEINTKDVLSVKLDTEDIQVMEEANPLNDMDQEPVNPQTAITALKNSVYFSKWQGLVRAAGYAPEEFDINQVIKGFGVEQEHADVTQGNDVETMKIVMAHLTEKPDYYDMLEKVENTKIQNYITESNGKFIVHAESGKKLGEYDSRYEAEKRLHQIEYFKHQNSVSADFVESEHPRANDGKFTKTKGSGKVDQDKNDIKRQKLDEKFQEQQKSRNEADQKAFEKARKMGIAIPPAWHDVWVSDTNAPGDGILAKGRDKYNQVQQVRTAERNQQAWDEKFKRIRSLLPTIPEKIDRIKSDIHTEESKVLYLISQMAFRIGGENVNSKVKAYGATTLLGSHVSIDNGVVKFDFIGKKGVPQHHETTDPIIMDIVKNKVGKNTPLFNTNANKVRLKWREFGGYKVHDFRSVIATNVAKDAMKSVNPPTTDKEFKKAILEVATQAAKKLGNRPAESYATYIDHQIFNDWKKGLNP